MKKTLIAALVAASFAPVLAFAEAGDIVVRLRGTHITPDESSNLRGQTEATYGVASSNAVYGAGNTANLQVDSNTIPELDISY